MDRIEAIYREHFRGVYMYLLSLTHDESLAEELAQEAMLRAILNIDSFRGDSAIFSWLCRIAKNLYIDWLRKNRRIVAEDDIAGLFNGSDIEIEYADKETAGRIFAEVDRLDEPYRQVFLMRALGDMQYDKISRLYGKSDSWARVVYYRAKARIIKALKAEGRLYDR
ncbi:MAG: RNA polymerase sigma factor [Clostridiales bacterium]|nr:RNA polymerase sigma factor [Clostridiales bacterium]